MSVKENNSLKQVFYKMPGRSEINDELCRVSLGDYPNEEGEDVDALHFRWDSEECDCLADCVITIDTWMDTAKINKDGSIKVAGLLADQVADFEIIPLRKATV